jgi:hypothetical protein
MLDMYRQVGKIAPDEPASGAKLPEARDVSSRKDTD